MTYPTYRPISSPLWRLNALGLVLYVQGVPQVPRKPPRDCPLRASPGFPGLSGTALSGPLRALSGPLRVSRGYPGARRDPESTPPLRASRIRRGLRPRAQPRYLCARRCVTYLSVHHTTQDTLPSVVPLHGARSGPPPLLAHHRECNRQFGC